MNKINKNISLDLPKDPFMSEVVQKENIIRRGINSEEGLINKESTGFFETVGPQKTDPASTLVSSFWTNKLMSLLNQENKKPAPDTITIKLLNAMVEYPQNSNIENYILLKEFLNEADVNDIWKQMIDKVYPNITDVDRASLLSDIDKRHFLSLMVFISRNSINGYIFTNKDREINESLDTQFFQVNHDPEYSSIIKNIFINYINTSKTSSAFILEYINSILHDAVGKYIWKIYINGFQKENGERTEFNLSEKLIGDRTIQWLKNKDDIGKRIDRLPIEYIFDIYTESERRIIMKEMNVCKEISDITKQMGKYSIPKDILTINKIPQTMSPFSNYYGPNILKSEIINRKNEYFEKNRLSKQAPVLVKQVPAPIKEPIKEPIITPSKSKSKSKNKSKNKNKSKKIKPSNPYVIKNPSTIPSTIPSAPLSEPPSPYVYNPQPPPPPIAQPPPNPNPRPILKPRLTKLKFKK